MMKCLHINFCLVDGKALQEVVVEAESFLRATKSYAMQSRVCTLLKRSEVLLSSQQGIAVLGWSPGQFSAYNCTTELPFIVRLHTSCLW